MPVAILAGLIGAGIEKSLTPAMHECEGAAQGLVYIYRPIDLDRLGLSGAALPDLLTAAERLGFNGLNITYPCKQMVIAHLHELSKDARDLGAVNTVVFRDGRRIGYNTDWLGFVEGFRRDLAGASLNHVVLLGAGGAGSAVAQALLFMGARQLTIVDTDREKARGLANALETRFGGGSVSAGEVEDAVPRADGLVNATPVGMAMHPGVPLDPALLRASQWVADIIYFPIETELLRHARRIGCRAINGGGMAVFQAVEAFRLISGREAVAGRMQSHFEALCSTQPVLAPDH
jgi:quinate/shikimate dehydrogenase (NAD+)